MTAEFRELFYMSKRESELRDAFLHQVDLIPEGRKIQQFNFLLMSVITLVVSAVVSFLYSLIVHGSGEIDWATSFRMAITLGILFTWLMDRERRAKQKQQ